MSNNTVDAVPHQFFCDLHQFGWSVESDGSNTGCLLCGKRESFIENLRELATFLEKNEAAPCPLYLTAQVSVMNREAFLKAARGIGFAEKEFADQWLSLKKQFGDDITYEIFTKREQFCERRVVGTRTVPEHVEEVVEWECSESLLKSGAE